MEEPVMRIERVEYYYTVVPNKVGAGAKVFNELKAQDVSLLAFNGFPLDEVEAYGPFPVQHVQKDDIVNSSFWNFTHN